MALLTVVPVVVLTTVATRNTRSSVEEEIIEANRTRVAWAAQYLEEILLALDGMFYSIRLDGRFDAILRSLELAADGLTIVDGGSSAGTAPEGADGNAAGGTAARRDVARLLSDAYFAHSRVVEEIGLYIAATGEAITVDNVAAGRVVQPDPTRPPWSGIAETPVALLLRSADASVYAIHTVNRFEDQSFRGALAARLDPTIAQTLTDILIGGAEEEVYLVNEWNEAVIGRDSRLDAGVTSAELEAARTAARSASTWQSDDRIGFARRIDRGRLVVAKTIPTSVVRRSARTTVAAGLVTGSVVAGLSVVLAVLFSLRLSRPIVELAKSMQHEGLPDFGTLAVGNHDEVRLLEEGYHALMARMKVLVQHEYEQEIELKDARLMALQAQINPHFLNNTLNLLGGMALAKGAPEVYTLARAVGDMFRYAVGSEGDLVSLQQELAHVRNYLLIQEHRFAGRCTITVDAAPEVSASAIPRFTLQPLVENAFEHGLQKKTGAWELEVRCVQQHRGTMVRIRDNGVGMSAQRLAALRAALAEARETRRSAGDGSTGIGVRNVHARVRLHFGDRYGVRVFGRAGGGTTVVVVLPRGGNRT